MLSDITRPTALLNEETARRNIARMAEKARRSGVRFRPHFKTHQSAVIGEWFRAEGVTAIAVSSVSMARYFAAHGWRDILIAFPVNWREIEAINALAKAINLHLLVESVETVRFLSERLAFPVMVWLKVDTGYGRTGLRWDDLENLKRVARAVEAGRQMTLCGVLTHAGHSYQARSVAELRSIFAATVGRIRVARGALEQAGFSGLQTSVGDTPCCSVVEGFAGVDEVRPGNFVFYDMMQVQIGACRVEDVAVAVACPVVAIHPGDRRIVIYGGAVHLSKERLALDDGAISYGAVALPDESRGWGPPLPGCYVASLSQEHGVIRASDDLLAQARVGDLLMVLPVHSCLTVDLLKVYRTLASERIPMMGAG
ncbi:MAG: alanine racemase [Anaerolineae bacterium]|nr:alanine racemase [Anaerolineae bacterium]